VLARLLGADREQARNRAAELLGLFELDPYADLPARVCSGGLRRRLDLAASLVGTPEVLFLDEPSTGLDPVSRSGLWDLVAGLAEAGTTVVLTTQYLEEADRLADQVIVLGLGQITLAGSPARLKSALGNQVVSLKLENSFETERLLSRIAGFGLPATRRGASTIAVAVTGPADIAGLVRLTDAEGVLLCGFTVTEPTLDDVYRSVHQPMVVPS
jgi:ABC-2 type transport system ATP-binding protein